MRPSHRLRSERHEPCVALAVRGHYAARMARALLPLFSVITLAATNATASGFGVEAGAALHLRGYGPAIAADFRLSSLHVGGFEFRAGVLIDAPRVDRQEPLAHVMLLPRYRTPALTFGAFAFTFVGGVGLSGWTTCELSGCLTDFGPLIEASPTLSLRTSATLQPFLALNGFVVSTFSTRTRVQAGAALVLGVAFDFNPAPPRSSPPANEAPPQAAPTLPVSPSSEPARAPSP